MKIGLDFDGVIANCGKLKADNAKKLYGLDLSPAKFKKEIIIGEDYLTAEQYRNLQKHIYCTREAGLLMEPVKNALDYLPLLMDSLDKVTIITSRDKEALEIAEEWSVGHGLELDFIGVGPGSKAKAAQSVDLYVDDDLDKIKPLVDIVEHRFLFTWGYNQHVDPTSVARRVKSWPELYDIIQELSDDDL